MRAKQLTKSTWERGLVALVVVALLLQISGCQAGSTFPQSIPQLIRPTDGPTSFTWIRIPASAEAQDRAAVSIAEVIHTGIETLLDSPHLWTCLGSSQSDFSTLVPSLRDPALYQIQNFVQLDQRLASGPLADFRRLVEIAASSCASDPGINIYPQLVDDIDTEIFYLSGIVPEPDPATHFATLDQCMKEVSESIASQCHPLAETSEDSSPSGTQGNGTGSGSSGASTDDGITRDDLKDLIEQLDTECRGTCELGPGTVIEVKKGTDGGDGGGPTTVTSEDRGIGDTPGDPRVDISQITFTYSDNEAGEIIVTSVMIEEINWNGIQDDFVKLLAAIGVTWTTVKDPKAAATATVGQVIIFLTVSGYRIIWPNTRQVSIDELKRIHSQKRMCPEGQGIFDTHMPSGSPFTGLTYQLNGTPLTIQESYNACNCLFQGEQSSLIGWGCKDEAAQRRDCAMAPYGPDDAPRPECLALLAQDNNIDWPQVCRPVDCPDPYSLLQNCTCGQGSPENPPIPELGACFAMRCADGSSPAIDLTTGTCSCISDETQVCEDPPCEQICAPGDPSCDPTCIGPNCPGIPGIDE
jgi:hypothetical protein